MTTTAVRMMSGIMAAMMFYHLHGTAGFPGRNAKVEEESAAAETEIAEIEPVILDGFQHEDFLGEQTVRFPWTDPAEPLKMPVPYLPLFINGSVTDCTDVYMQDGVPMVPVETVCRALGEEPVSDEEYLPADVLAELLDAEYSYYNDDERCEKRMETSEKPHMLYSADHVMFGKYADTAVKKTAEEAVEYLKSQLIIAYKNQYDTAFVPTEDVPEQNWGEDWDRWRISTLSVDDILCETDRFYVIPYGWEFYVDKYTDEVYQMYNGLNNVITRVDFTKKGALSFAG